MTKEEIAELAAKMSRAFSKSIYTTPERDPWVSALEAVLREIKYKEQVCKKEVKV